MRPATLSVGTRLTIDQAGALEKLAAERQLTVAKLIRKVLLEALGQAELSKSGPDPVLSEVIGIRLLIVNLLRPSEESDIAHFDDIVDQIKTTKREIALEIKTKGY